jgi:hypothetical protein
MKDEPIYLENSVEANLVETVLKQEDIPHFIRSYGDLAYDGLFQFQKGWGCVEAPEEYREKIRAVLAELRSHET